MQTPPNTRTICVDELGPLTAKTYPGSDLSISPEEKDQCRSPTSHQTQAYQHKYNYHDFPALLIRTG